MSAPGFGESLEKKQVGGGFSFNNDDLSARSSTAVFTFPSLPDSSKPLPFGAGPSDSVFGLPSKPPLFGSSLPDSSKPPLFGSSSDSTLAVFESTTNMQQTGVGSTITTATPTPLASSNQLFPTASTPSNFKTTSPFGTTDAFRPSMTPFGSTPATAGSATFPTSPSTFPTSPFSVSTPSSPFFRTTPATTGSATFPTSPFSVSTPSTTPFGTTLPPNNSFFPTQPTTPFTTSPAFGNGGAEASTPTMHVCQKCGNKSFWGSRGTPYAPTPDSTPAAGGHHQWPGKSQVSAPFRDTSLFVQPQPAALALEWASPFVNTSTLAADHGPYPWQGKAQVEDKYISSISAMPIHQDKSHEELRWEDYQSPGKSKTQVSVEPFKVHSATFAHAQPQHSAFNVNWATFGHTTQPQLPALPVIMLPVALMPPNSVYNSFGFNGIP